MDPYLVDIISASNISLNAFSIVTEPMNRINALLATRKDKLSKKKPCILLLSGNPPGTVESLLSSAIYFAYLGYHAVAVERRPSARTLYNKDTFLTCFADPVFDIIRLIDYLNTQDLVRVSRIGIYGFSTGAVEGRFAAAFDDRISAIVLACGTTSHNSLFSNKAWFPTYSGLIVFRELGLGNINVATISNGQARALFEQIKPSHNRCARRIYERLFPFFKSMDGLRSVPLVAPAPLLIIAGNRDVQFGPKGVRDVTVRTRNVYREFRMQSAFQVYIQPLVGHAIRMDAALLTAAFYYRWLR